MSERLENVQEAYGDDWSQFSHLFYDLDDASRSSRRFSGTEGRILEFLGEFVRIELPSLNSNTHLYYHYLSDRIALADCDFMKIDHEDRSPELYSLLVIAKRLRDSYGKIMALQQVGAYI